MTKNKDIKLDQKSSSEMSKSEEFRPTPHMLVWLDTQVRLGTDVVAEIERESNIAEQNWYRWIKDPAFEDWYWEQYDKRTRRWKPTVDAIGLKFAKRGSAEHFKYLAQRVGNVKEKNDNTTIPVQINNFIEGKKDEYGI